MVLNDRYNKLAMPNLFLVKFFYKVIVFQICTPSRPNMQCLNMINESVILVLNDNANQICMISVNDI